MTPSPMFTVKHVLPKGAWACAGLCLLLIGCESSAPPAAIPVTPATQAAKPVGTSAESGAETVDDKPSAAPGDTEKSLTKREEGGASTTPADTSNGGSGSVGNAASAENTVAAAPAETKSDTKVAARPLEPGEAVPITFEDINLNMQADIVFRPWMLTDRVKELEGKRVRLSGYMHGSVTQLKKIKEFVMLKNTECKFGAGGQADHLINVRFQGDASASYTNTPVQVEGVLKLNPFQGPDGNTWSVFDLLGESIKPVRKL